MTNAFVMASLPPKSQRTYGTAEQWTGEYWIDGKKIYRKTFVMTMNAESKDAAADIGAQVETIIFCAGFGKSSSNTWFPFVGTNGNGGQGNYPKLNGIHVRGNNITIFSGIESLFGEPVNITLWYTKVTE